MRLSAPLLASLLLANCTGPASAPPPGEDWTHCSVLEDCALVQTRAGGCCDYGEFRGVNARYLDDARRAWGPSAEELRQAHFESMTCTAGCVAPPQLVATCRAGSCVVATSADAP